MALPGNDTARPVRLWLYGMAGLVFVMMIVGGATRLTDSGLSITEWRPILGMIPPLSDAEWQRVFALYRKTPEYVQVNYGMSLADFKTIWWWEWGHRRLGVVIGLAFLLPFLVFFATHRLPQRLGLPLLGLFVLGGMQGLLGWYMVQSGLVDRVDVSHYRLVAHLLLACAIFAALIWVGRGLLRADWRAGNVSNRVAAGALILLFMIFAQIALGGLVAGLHAGQAYNTWPRMGAQWVPEGLWQWRPIWLNAVENPIFVQFSHRLLAYILILGALGHAIAVWSADPLTRRYGMALAVATVAQAALGVLVLVHGVPVLPGVVHQAGAIIVLALAVVHVQRLFAARTFGAMTD